jgi:polyisoprenoid-binding protein YceI
MRAKSLLTILLCAMSVGVLGTPRFRVEFADKESSLPTSHKLKEALIKCSVNCWECGGPAPLWPAPVKHSTIAGQIGESGQSAAGPAHSKELALPLDQRFLKCVGHLGALVPSLQNGSTHRFRLDSSQSKFIAHAHRGGLLWFKGHDHLVAAREFFGEAVITQNKITPASLELTVKTETMVETSDAFTEPQKEIINRELREIVLEPEKYPEIVFKSTEVKGKQLGNGQYEVKIGGDLTLHGVTRHIVIPAKVTVTGSSLRAIGEFSIDRSDFNVKATSAFHGMVRVGKKVKFTFDIVGHRV